MPTGKPEAIKNDPMTLDGRVQTDRIPPSARPTRKNWQRTFTSRATVCGSHAGHKTHETLSPGRLTQSISRLRRRRIGLPSPHAAPPTRRPPHAAPSLAIASPMARYHRQRPPCCDAPKPASPPPQVDGPPRYPRRPHGLPDGCAVLGATPAPAQPPP
jgi:hypothetical protein